MIERIFQFILIIINILISGYKDGREIGAVYSIDRSSIYSGNDPMRYFPVEYLFRSININNLYQLSNNEEMNINTPLKLLYIDEDKSTKENGNKVIKFPLKFLKNYTGNRMYLIQIRNVISSYDFNNEKIIKKLLQERIRTNNKEVLIEDYGWYEENKLELELDINDNSNYNYYMLVFVGADGSINYKSEIFMFICEKQFIQRTTEGVYLNSLLRKKEYGRFMYYLKVMMANVTTFNERFNFGIEINSCKNKTIVFDRENYEFNDETDEEIVKLKLKNLHNLIFTNNSNGELNQNGESTTFQGPAENYQPHEIDTNLSNYSVSNTAIGNTAINLPAINYPEISNANIGTSSTFGLTSYDHVDISSMDPAENYRSPDENAANLSNYIIGNTAIDNTTIDNTAIGNTAIDIAAIDNTVISNAAIGTSSTIGLKSYDHVDGPINNGGEEKNNINMIIDIANTSTSKGEEENNMNMIIDNENSMDIDNGIIGNEDVRVEERKTSRKGKEKCEEEDEYYKYYQ